MPSSESYPEVLSSGVGEAGWSGFSAAGIVNNHFQLSEDTGMKEAEGSGRHTVQHEQLSQVVQPWHLSQEQLSPMLKIDILLWYVS